MGKNNLTEKVKEAGFDSLDSFVRSNLHYLPESKQRLFYKIADTNTSDYQEKNQNRYCNS